MAPADVADVMTCRASSGISFGVMRMRCAEIIIVANDARGAIDSSIIGAGGYWRNHHGCINIPLR